LEQQGTLFVEALKYWDSLSLGIIYIYMEGELCENLEKAYPLSESQSKAGNLPGSNLLIKVPEMYIS
jgi:hypothetical protein